MAIALVNLVMIAYYFVIPESPRWLLAAGQFTEAEAIMRKIGKWNGTDQYPEFESEFQDRWEKVVKAFAAKISYNEDGSTPKLSFWNTVKEILHQVYQHFNSFVFIIKTMKPPLRTTFTES